MFFQLKQRYVAGCVGACTSEQSYSRYVAESGNECWTNPLELQLLGDFIGCGGKAATAHWCCHELREPVRLTGWLCECSAHLCTSVD